MRLPRNVKMLRGPIDASALAGALFVLWTVTLLHSSLVVPPGVRLQLPEAPGLWGDTVPQLTVAVDAAGRFLFEQQLVTESNLEARLMARAAEGGRPLTLLLLADRAVPTATLARLANLARAAGIPDVVLATSPRPGAADTPSSPRER